MIIFCRALYLRRFQWIGILILFIIILTVLIISTSDYNAKECSLLDSPHLDGICRRVMLNDQQAIDEASQFSYCRRHDRIYDSQYSQLTENCDKFISDMKYNTYHITQEEKEFPLAFSILMHESIEQTERLLRLIYRPHNVYCIHIDKKSSSSLFTAAQAISRCLPNVILAERAIHMRWGEFPLLEAELVCVNQLFNGYKDWKYYLNLGNRDFPLKTNYELVRILKSYNGANDVDGSLHKRPILWTMFEWRNENWRTGTLKSPAPHKFNIAKGSTHMAGSRAFIDFALNNVKARDLLEWMRNIRAPDEHFFMTLNHNPHLGVPGAYKGDPDLKWFQARLKLWQSKTEVCHGEWVRYICNLGVGDLPRLVSAMQLFVNKIRLEQDPTAFACLENWYREKTAREYDDKYRQSFNTTFYENLVFVKDHV